MTSSRRPSGRTTSTANPPPDLPTSAVTGTLRALSTIWVVIPTWTETWSELPVAAGSVGCTSTVTVGALLRVPPPFDEDGVVATVPTEVTIPAYISLDDPAAVRGFDAAPVQVDITTEGVENALSVPVTALVGKAGSGFAVEVVRADGRHELVAVKLGLFDSAGGRVQVEGDLHESDQVVVPTP